MMKTLSDWDQRGSKATAELMSFGTETDNKCDRDILTFKSQLADDVG